MDKMLMMLLLVFAGFDMSSTLRQRYISLTDMANCRFKNNICKRVRDCKVDLWFQQEYLFFEDCTSILGSSYVLCDDCWLDIDQIASKIHVTGVNTIEKQMDFYNIILLSISSWCPKMRCNIKKFKAWPEEMTSLDFFSNLSREDIVYLGNDVADRFETKLVILKKFGKETAIGAVHPDDVVRILRLHAVQKLFTQSGIVVKDERDNHKGFNLQELNETMTSAKKRESLNARILLAILFGVLTIGMILGGLVLRNKKSCLNARTAECRLAYDDSAENLNGIDQFIQPPPYTREDAYIKGHSPPPYAQAV